MQVKLFLAMLAGNLGGGRYAVGGSEAYAVEQHRISTEIATVVVAVRLPDPFGLSDGGGKGGAAVVEPDGEVNLARTEWPVNGQQPSLLSMVHFAVSSHHNCHPKLPVMLSVHHAFKCCGLLFPCCFSRVTAPVAVVRYCGGCSSQQALQGTREQVE
jgi:hypothetical protein